MMNALKTDEYMMMHAFIFICMSDACMKMLAFRQMNASIIMHEDECMKKMNA